VVENKDGFQFDFEKLIVYQKTLVFIDHAFDIYKQMSGDYKIIIGSNLIRAAMSVANNIAEGNGKKSLREKNRYFSISLDSMRECLSVFNVMKRQKLIEDKVYLNFRSQGREITSMLWKMTRG